MQKKDVFTTAPNINPTWQFKWKRITDLNENSLCNLKTKYKKEKYALKEKSAKSIASEQSNELANVLSDNEVSNNEQLTAEFKDIISIYNIGKIAILSLLFADHNRKLLSYAIALKDRMTLQVPEGLIIPKTVKYSWVKLGKNKCKHFLDFLFGYGLLQNVLYGRKKMQYSINTAQIVPQTVITVSCKHIISYYFQFCYPENVQHLSESRL